ncbi:hypothetical protein Tco_0433348 [Tanacetum coccineum]
MVNLDADDEDDVKEQTLTNTYWTRDEEILLTETWVEVSQNVNIGNDRTDEAFWNQIMEDFNTATKSVPRTKNMMMGKWSRITSDCQKRKCEATKVAYEAKRKKELGFLKCRELEFLLIDSESLPPQKAA